MIFWLWDTRTSLALAVFAFMTLLLPASCEKSNIKIFGQMQILILHTLIEDIHSSAIDGNIFLPKGIAVIIANLEFDIIIDLKGKNCYKSKLNSHFFLFTSVLTLVSISLLLTAQIFSPTTKAAIPRIRQTATLIMFAYLVFKNFIFLQNGKLIKPIIFIKKYQMRIEDALIWSTLPSLSAANFTF